MKSQFVRHLFLTSIASLSFISSGSASMADSDVKDKFTALINFSLGEPNPIYPDVRMYVGKTLDRRSCVVTQSSGAQASGFEVVTLDAGGTVDTEPLGYELSTRRKYDSLEVAVTGTAAESRLVLTSYQSMGGMSKVAYEIVLLKNSKGLNDFRISYQNQSFEVSRAGSQSIECSNLQPLVLLPVTALSALADNAKVIFERNQKEKLGPHQKTIIPRCQIESAGSASCEYAYQSPRIPDYLKVTYALSQKGLGNIQDMSITRGH